MDAPTPQKEHKWLQRLIGNWTFEGEYSMGPGQPMIKNSGREVVKPLGELWTLGTMTVESAEGSTSDNLMTLGFDPRQNRFVGTFISSMMTHLWPYNGSLDPRGKILTLESEGPSFTEEGAIARYRDMIEFIDENRRELRSEVLTPDGTWLAFMKTVYQRVDN